VHTYIGTRNAKVEVSVTRACLYPKEKGHYDGHPRENGILRNDYSSIHIIIIHHMKRDMDSIHLMRLNCDHPGRISDNANNPHVASSSSHAAPKLDLELFEDDLWSHIFDEGGCRSCVCYL
jgi:hypothetical protein